MSKFARVFPQLRVGIPTAHVDCGVRAIQSGLHWLSKGTFSSNVSRIREVGNMGDGPTNYFEWDVVIDTLAGQQVGGVGVKTNSLAEVKDYLKNRGAVQVAVDYGWYRRKLPGKSGSKTFDGNHAITFIGGFKNKSEDWMSTSTDSLLDGRYAGCPKGPVNVPLWHIGEAMKRTGGIYAVLLYRDKEIAPVEPGEQLEDFSESSLASILAELYELHDRAPSQKLLDIIKSFELQLGFSYDPEAGYERLESGVLIPA
jgi:hypothetical protein